MPKPPDRQHPFPGDRRVPLEAVISTAELRRRGARPADYESENRALASLMQAMARSCEGVLQRLVETALDLCGAHSAGVSLLQEEDGREVFRWAAVAGRWSCFRGSAMPRESPCGAVLDRNSVLLMSHPQRHYSLPAELAPPIVEVLLIPFHAAGKPVGTVWVIAHDESCRFDGEDERLMTRLSQFAATAYQMSAAQQDLQSSEAHLRALSQGLERRVEVRTAELQRQAARLRYLAGELATVERHERKRLAALLHDDLQQLLVAATMRLGRACGQVQDPAAVSEIGGVTDLLGQAMTSSRHLTHQLRSPGLYEGGLVSGLRLLASEFSKLHDLHVIIDVQDVELPLSDDLKAPLLGAVRELLFNVVKHAGVKKAAVRVRQNGQQLQIAVEDQGVGFDAEVDEQNWQGEPQGHGTGLFNIRERLAAIGGDMALESVVGGGARVRLTLLLPPE